jgi:putative transport protein
MKIFFDFISLNPLLLLFIVTAVGYPLGKIKVKGVSLGVSAVLFTGIIFGSIDPRLQLPEIVYTLGLTFFVYSIGLSSGHSFITSFRRTGLRDSLFTFFSICFAFLSLYLLTRFFHFTPSVASGIFCGSLTNTPALAGVLETLKSQGSTAELLTQPVVGYSLAYPFGVIGVILALFIFRRLGKIDYNAEALKLKKTGGGSEEIKTATICIDKPEATGIALNELFKKHHLDLVAGRMKRGNFNSLTTSDAVLKIGDSITITGSTENLERVTVLLGFLADNHPELDSREFDHRRIFVSNRNVFGKSVRELDFETKFGAIISRVRRGDIDMLVHPDTILQPGDRVRVVSQRDQIDEISKYLGDSYKEASEMDLLTFSLGLTFGVLLGMIPIPLPGLTIKLGFAGGPLIAGILLGTLEHTGKLNWNLPYSSHISLRQIGLVLFLAGIGTRAGYGFGTILQQGGALPILISGILVTTLTALFFLIIGYKFLKIPLSILSGMLAGLVTQPAVLAHALEQTKNDLPNIGYASVYPIAIILKIITAQVFLLLS